MQISLSDYQLELHSKAYTLAISLKAIGYKVTYRQRLALRLGAKQYASIERAINA